MARLDTGWHNHPKILRLGWAAMGLHAWSISYCDATLSDGFIPTGAWPSLPGGANAVKALVTADLWIPAVGGYLLHDYTDYNRTRAQVESVRAAMRANGQAGGQATAKAKSQQIAKQTVKQTLKQKPTPGPGSTSLAVFNSLATERTNSPETIPESGDYPGARTDAPTREAVAARRAADEAEAFDNWHREQAAVVAASTT